MKQSFLARKAALVFALGVFGCGDAPTGSGTLSMGLPSSPLQPLSTSAGDRPPLEVMLNYRQTLQEINGDGSLGKRCFSGVDKTVVVCNIESMECLPGGQFSLIGTLVAEAVGNDGLVVGVVPRRIEITDYDLSWIHSAEFWGYVGADEDELRPRSDGLYAAREDEDSGVFLWFLDDSRVRQVLCADHQGHPNLDGAAKFILGHQACYEGRYGISDGLLRISVPVEEGLWQYIGRVTDRGLSPTPSPGQLEFRFHELQIKH